MIHDSPLLLLNDFARARLSSRCRPPLRIENLTFSNVVINRVERADDSFERIDQIRDESDWRRFGLGQILFFCTN